MNNKSLPLEGLAKILCVKFNMPMADALSILYCITESIQESVENNIPVKIKRFGTFYAHHVPERVFMNPVTNIPARYEKRSIFSFRPSSTTKFIQGTRSKRIE